MIKLTTLRNIIALFVVLFLSSCNENGGNTDKLQTISSEDRTTLASDISVSVVSNPQNGQSIYIVQSK